MRFIDRFCAFINDNRLFKEEQFVLLAVSGGKDSVLMTDLFAEAQLKFGIAHCNFQLRGASSDADEIFVRKLAERLNVPFYSFRFDTEIYAAEQQISIQMAARDLRYEWLESVRRGNGYDYIAIAHHQTDSVETVLLNMLRGTGVAGLVGILPKRDVLVRPLLAFSNQEVKNEVFRRQLEFREDASNASTKYKRNKIRLDVLPHLRELNDNIETTFAYNSKRFHQIDQLIKKIVSDFRAMYFLNQDDGAFRINLAALKALDPLDLWVYELFHQYGFTEPVLRDLVSSWDHRTGKRFLSSSYELLVDRDDLILSPLSQKKQKKVSVSSLPCQFRWGHDCYLIRIADRADIDVGQFPVMVDFDQVKIPLTVRSWQEGDRFQPLGMRGKKKISDLLIEQKVPLNKKSEIPILVDAKGFIVAVWPWRIDERFKITAKTKKVIIFEKTKHG